jgi:uncharacterized membrane protein (Fun14 family)
MSKMSYSELITPLVTQLGAGGVVGFIVGFAVKKLLKLLAIVVGLIFAFVQYLAWQGFIEVHYDRIYTAAQNILHQAGATIMGFNVPAFITANIPMAGSFVVGFGVGFKMG